MRRRLPVVIACVGALAAAAAVALRTSAAARPDRVWAFLPEPAWSEDPPPRVAFEKGGPPLADDVWNLTPVTQTGAALAASVEHQPSAWWRRLSSVLGTRARPDLYVSKDGGAAVRGGRWFECVRADLGPDDDR